MTLNGVMAVILRYSTELGIALGVHYVKVVEDRPILFVTKCSKKNLLFINI